MPAFAQTPVLPEATPVGALSAGCGLLRPLNVDSRRRPKVSNAQIAAIWEMTWQPGQSTPKAFTSRPDFVAFARRTRCANAPLREINYLRPSENVPFFAGVTT